MAGSSRVFIKSDFKDYYDTATSQMLTSNSVVYNRSMKDVPGRVAELKLINSLGIKTVQIMPVKKIPLHVQKVVVYTDPFGHRGEGKMLMPLSEANMLYSNRLATEYFECNKEITYKILNIGKRRFRCILKNRESLVETEIIQLDELPGGYNHSLALPIYSLDYVKSNSGEMLVVDFNTIQRLDYLDMERVITPDEIMKEIYGALIAYNKL